MDDMPRQARPPNGHLLLLKVWGGAGAGLMWGALAGAMVGAVVGAGVGLWNEVTVPAEEYEELVTDFAEYSSLSMAFFGAIVCAFLGAIGGTIGSEMGAVSRKAWLSMVASPLGEIAALIALGVIYWPPEAFWKRANLVFAIGGIAGAAIASVYCARIACRMARQKR
jgi:hypothetical protein